MNTAVNYMWNSLIELNPKIFHHKEDFFSFILKLSEIIMDVY